MKINPTASDLPEMTSRAAEVKAEQNGEVGPKPAIDAKQKKRQEEFRSRIDTAKHYRRKLVSNWSINIDYRRGKPFASQSDDDQVCVNLDWSLTKTKQATLFSQVPQVRVNHHPESAQAGPGLALYERKLNDTLVVGGIEAAMDEVLPDCINAAGFGAVLVSYETLSEDKEVPKIDVSILPPEVQKEIAETGKFADIEIPMETVPQVTDKRYMVSRLSPSDFLWPMTFLGSNFDNAPWLGRTGRVTWAEAVQRWNLSEDEKDQYVGEDKTVMDKLTHDIERDKISPDQMVEFDEIFYKESAYDSKAPKYDLIHHMIFVCGKPEPVVDEAWKGQKFDDAQGKVIGATKFPIRVLTLAYITDDVIPPSDSAIGRPQVNEINKSRTQVLMQRARNIPVRWGDVNRIDPSIMQSLMKGTWQNIIPVQGDGSRVLGEVAKSGHPVENPAFDQVAKNDLAEAWSIGPNQMGSGEDVETKGESSEIASSFQTRIGRERAKVGSFVIGIAEILGGFLCLYEDPTSFGEGFDPSFSTKLAFSITVDSTVLLDAKQRLKYLNEFVNVYAKSGFIALEPVLREIAILNGLDPNVVIKAPDPSSPPPPNISLRLTGAEDMMNPLNLAFLIKSGQAPGPQEIEAAKMMIQAAVMNPAQFPPQPPQPPGGPEGSPEGPPEAVGEAHPDATILPKITKRSDDPSGGI